MTEEQFASLTPEQQKVYHAREMLSNTLFNITRNGRLDIGNIEAFSNQIYYNLRLVESMLKKINGED